MAPPTPSIHLSALHTSCTPPLRFLRLLCALKITVKYSVQSTIIAFTSRRADQGKKDSIYSSPLPPCILRPRRRAQGAHLTLCRPKTRRKLRNENTFGLTTTSKYTTVVPPSLEAPYRTCTEPNAFILLLLKQREHEQVSAHNKGVIGDGMVGLGNLGNTCYINSSVQCLSHTPLLTEYFLSSAYVNDVNVENKLGLQVGRP